jgi:alpha-tubulin suppressor-like RCC1 family protein
VLVALGLNWSVVAAGFYHTCGLTVGGLAYCWGDDWDSGTLGIGSTGGLRNSPVPVVGGHRFVSLTAGTMHSCAVTSGGVAYCWGNNWSGQLGDGSITCRNVPVVVAGGFAFASLTAGEYHTCGVTTGGDAYCWGANGAGQLGVGTTTGRPTPGPIANP